MRIGVSGTHGTGKTTLADDLCAALAGHAFVAEPYVLLEEEGHIFADPPTAGDFRAQLATSLLLLGSRAEDAVFDRTPADFLAYLAVCGRAVEDEVAPDELAAAMSSLDLLVLVPVTAETERLLPAAELPGLRRAADEALAEILHADPLDAWEHLPILELTGPLDRRVEAVLAALDGLA